MHSILQGWVSASQNKRRNPRGNCSGEVLLAARYGVFSRLAGGTFREAVWLKQRLELGQIGDKGAVKMNFMQRFIGLSSPLLFRCLLFLHFSAFFFLLRPFDNSRFCS
uniref:uncharacterized protein LOC105350163 n=1 Tax=Fragaria vesca subsp. vesca TaxID=101020 RepID=UPI0005C92B4D|nr:PREDICTED: uncharacterized protein LOC105350163 [Fragaria vesca subsp. vesca]